MHNHVQFLNIVNKQDVMKENKNKRICKDHDNDDQFF